MFHVGHKDESDVCCFDFCEETVKNINKMAIHGYRSEVTALFGVLSRNAKMAWLLVIL